MRTWSIIEDLKGMPTHEEGGVDLTVVDGVPLIHGGKVRASNGLHISREDIDRKKAKIQAMKKARGSNTISIEKQKFYDTYSPYALELEKKEGIPAEASLSQMWIETGGGKFDIEKSGGNPFGIFAWDDYEGDVTMIDTSEHLRLEDIREENGKKVWGKRSYPVLNEPTPIEGTDKYYVETQRPLIDVKGDYNKAFELYGNTIKNTDRKGYKYALENKSDYRKYLSGVVMGGYGTGVNYGSEAIKNADEFHNYRKSLERGYEWSDYPKPEKQELEMPITNTSRTFPDGGLLSNFRDINRKDNKSRIKAADGLVIGDPPSKEIITNAENRVQNYYNSPEYRQVMENAGLSDSEKRGILNSVSNTSYEYHEEKILGASAYVKRPDNVIHYDDETGINTFEHELYHLGDYFVNWDDLQPELNKNVNINYFGLGRETRDYMKSLNEYRARINILRRQMVDDGFDFFNATKKDYKEYCKGLDMRTRKGELEFNSNIRDIYDFSPDFILKTLRDYADNSSNSKGNNIKNGILRAANGLVIGDPSEPEKQKLEMPITNTTKTFPNGGLLSKF